MSADAISTRTQRNRVLASSYIGSVIEWFDFYLYGIGAASVFSVLFFPSSNALLSMLGSLGTLAVAYLVRPIGGLIYGYYGDRLGRKRMLVSSIVLMGLSTVLVGVLPTYGQAGIWAPVLLVVLRIVQGLAVAGEWGGATLMALEHADPRRRGLWSCFSGMGISTGILLASGCFALLAKLPQDSFLAWGWRIPFLAASILIVVGLWVRLGVAESPVFLEDQRARLATDTARPPRPSLAGLIRTQWREITLAFCLTVGPFAISGVKGSFLVAYAIQIGVSRSATLDAVTISSFVSVIFMFIGGWTSDWFGRRTVVIVGGVLLSISSIVVFDFMQPGAAGLLIFAMCLVTGSHGIMYGPMSAFITELFPTSTRFTGASLAYQIAGVIGGGFAPVIATALLAAAGGVPHVQYVVAFMVGCSLMGLIAALVARETYRVDLNNVRTSKSLQSEPLELTQASAGYPASSKP